MNLVQVQCAQSHVSGCQLQRFAVQCHIRPGSENRSSQAGSSRGHAPHAQTSPRQARSSLGAAQQNASVRSGRSFCSGQPSAHDVLVPDRLTSWGCVVVLIILVVLVGLTHVHERVVRPFGSSPVYCLCFWPDVVPEDACCECIILQNKNKNINLEMMLIDLEAVEKYCTNSPLPQVRI